MIRILLIGALSLATSFSLLAQNREDKNVEQQIKKLEQARLDAYLHLDAKALERLMTDDYVSVYANGEMVSKSRELEGIKAAPAAHSRPLRQASISFPCDRMGTRRC